MQSNNPIESKKMRDARALAEILKQRELNFQKNGGIPLEVAFENLRKRAERMKILYADIFNNNSRRSRERPS